MRYDALLLVVWLAGSNVVAAAEPDPVRLKVAISELPPCVIVRGETPSGFSIDLWNAISDRIRVDSELLLVSFDEKIESVRSGSSDVAIGCISVSSTREQTLDFTHPIAEGGFQSMSLADSAWLPHFSDQSVKMLILLLAFVVLFAHLMWWSEQGQVSISDRYIPGVFESMWFSLVTMSTVGYGDIAPHRWLGRISAVLLILTGVTAFGIIFGQFAADAIGERAKYQISDSKDLQRYRVGTKKNTAADDFLTRIGANPVRFDDNDSATQALREENVDLVVFDSIVVADLVLKNSDLFATGPMFEPHYLGIALPQQSRWREPINTALLEIRQMGLYETIRQRWLD